MSTLKTNTILTTGGKPILQSTGSILQVVQTVFSSTFSVTTSLTGWTAVTGFTASIIPSSSSSKILITMNIAAGIAYYQWKGRFTRNSSAITGALGNQASLRPRATISEITALQPTTSYYNLSNVNMTYLDSPETTSSTTYGIEIGGYSNTYPVYVNRSYYFQDAADYDATPISTITLMEISA